MKDEKRVVTSFVSVNLIFFKIRIRVYESKCRVKEKKKKNITV